MIYAQFYQTSTGYVPGSVPPRFDPAHCAPIEACGDRSVVILDARLSNENIGRIARNECAKRGYVGYCIFKGYSFTRSAPISGYWPIASGPVDRTAASAIYGA